MIFSIFEIIFDMLYDMIFDMWYDIGYVLFVCVIVLLAWVLVCFVLLACALSLHGEFIQLCVICYCINSVVTWIHSCLLLLLLLCRWCCCCCLAVAMWIRFGCACSYQASCFFSPFAAAAAWPFTALKLAVGVCDLLCIVCHTSYMLCNSFFLG